MNRTWSSPSSSHRWIGVGPYVPTPGRPRAAARDPRRWSTSATAPAPAPATVSWSSGTAGSGPAPGPCTGAARSEDTVGAFPAAVRVGADGFETDFWPTAGGEVVSRHDRTLDRMTAGTGTIGGRTAG